MRARQHCERAWRVALVALPRGKGRREGGDDDAPFLCDDLAEAVDHAVVVLCAGDRLADLELHARLDLGASAVGSARALRRGPGHDDEEDGHARHLSGGAAREERERERERERGGEREGGGQRGGAAREPRQEGRRRVGTREMASEGGTREREREGGRTERVEAQELCDACDGSSGELVDERERCGRTRAEVSRRAR